MGDNTTEQGCACADAVPQLANMDAYDKRYLREQLAVALLPFFGPDTDGAITAAKKLEAFITGE